MGLLSLSFYRLYLSYLEDGVFFKDVIFTNGK